MQIFTRSLLATAVALSFSGSALAVKIPEGTQLSDKQEVVMNIGAEPQSFDPHKVEGSPEATVSYQLLEGLLTTDNSGNVIPAVAESWESSPDFKTWTYHLRKDAKWSNGDPVTAHDFVFSWKRLVDPKTLSPYASFLSNMKVINAEEIATGKVSPDQLGVKAVDDHTFVVSLSEAVPYASSFTIHQSLLPVNKKVVEKLGDDWVKKENFVGNGAYKMVNHVINEKIELERNPLYWNNNETVINKATLLEIPSSSTDVARYRAGEIDITNYAIPPELFQKLKQEIPDELFVNRTLGTYMYEINNNKVPFNDVRVRKALNLALDRNVITEKVLGQGQTPTYIFTPTYISEGGAIQQPAYSTKPMEERNAEAVKLLEEAGFSKANPLRFSILYNTDENHKKVAIAASAMWKANTKGLVDVKLENQEWKTYIGSRRSQNYDVARAGWSGDYNQATTFINYFLTNSTNNTSGYKNPAYDEAVKASFASGDKAGREQAYAKAETILAEDAPVIPVYNYVQPRLVKTYVKGYSGTDPQDRVFIKNLYIVQH